MPHKSRNVFFTVVNLTGPLNFPGVFSRVIGNVRVISKTNDDML